jgi:hypothetical protein
MDHARPSLALQVTPHCSNIDMTSLSLVPEHPVDSQSSRGPGSLQKDEQPAPRPPPRRSSQEIANLESAEAALDAMVVSYHKDRAGRKLYETMLDSWKSDDDDRRHDEATSVSCMPCMMHVDALVRNVHSICPKLSLRSIFSPLLV